MLHLSANIQSNRNIILWCQPRSAESPDKSRFIMLANELTFSCGYKIFKMKHFCFGGCELNGKGRKEAALHTFPITDNGDCWVTSIIQTQQTFHWDYLTMNSSLSLAFDSTKRQKKKRDGVRDRGGKLNTCLQSFQGKNAEINMKAEQNNKFHCISMQQYSDNGSGHQGLLSSTKW